MHLTVLCLQNRDASQYDARSRSTLCAVFSVVPAKISNALSSFSLSLPTDNALLEQRSA